MCGCDGGGLIRRALIIAITPQKQIVPMTIRCLVMIRERRVIRAIWLFGVRVIANFVEKPFLLSC